MNDIIEVVITIGLLLFVYLMVLGFTNVVAWGNEYAVFYHNSAVILHQEVYFEGIFLSKNCIAHGYYQNSYIPLNKTELVNATKQIQGRYNVSIGVCDAS